MTFRKGESGNRRGPATIILPPQQLAVVEKLASQGGRGPSFAKGLGISLSTWKTLKNERQAQEIAEAIDRGEATLHDALIINELKIAMQSSDERERRAATEFLLASRFAYRTHGEPSVSVGIDLGQRGPHLTIVQEVVERPRFQIAGDDPMVQETPQETTATHEPIVQRRSEKETALGPAWE